MQRWAVIILTFAILITGIFFIAKNHPIYKNYQNPLLRQQELPDFSAIKGEHFAPAIEHVLNNFNQVLWNEVLREQQPTWNNTVMPLEEAGEKIDRVWKLITHLHAVNNTNEIRFAYDQVLPKITEFNSEVMLNEKLYQAYLSLRKSKEFTHYNAAQKTIIKNAIRNFRLSGINLPEKKQQRFKELKQKTSKLGNKFAKNILDSVHSWEYLVTEENKYLLAGLPEHTISTANNKAKRKKKSGWLLTLDFPCYYAVITFAHNQNLRKTFYTAFHTKASNGKFNNTPIIDEILQSKQELAELLGFNNYAEYSLVTKMAENTEQVMEFLVKLAKHVKPFAAKEYAELKKFALEKYNVEKFEIWDNSYYSELYKREHYNISQESLRPYFPEQQVLTGMFKLAGSLFGITVSEIKNPNAWHDTVRLFAIHDHAGNLRGKFYADIYGREFKRGGAWMADLLYRMRFKNGKLQTPVAFLEANFAPAVNGKPALLSHTEVVTLFHEFGHALHHLLTQIDYPSVAGTNGVAWDAVELSSQLMENWCWEWEVIQEISKHYQTGESLPKAEFDKLLRAKNYQVAIKTLRQLEFALFDFRIHLNQPEDNAKTVQQILDEVREQVAIYPIPSFNRFQNSFHHVFNGAYDAGYYSYKWAEVLASDAFEKFTESGKINAEIGRQFREKILEQGGSRDFMELYVEFMGRKPKIAPLLRRSGIK